jgi:DNA replication protein DnaC
MMINQTAEKLRAMRLPAMAAEYIRQSELPAISALDFDERVGMMADAEWLSRDKNRVKRLTKEAKLRYPAACFADIDFRPSRKLDRAYIARLTDFAWAKEARNIILTGSTGTGKTWLACAFGAQACHIGLRVRFYRVSRLLGEMAVAAGTGCVDNFLDKLKKCNILILDDWGLSSLTLLEGKFLHEVFEGRCGEKSTIISAQLPVSEWHGLFEDGTVADAVLDRVVHNSYRLELQGPTMRLATGSTAAGIGGEGEHDA